jgi:hypothetical protein
VYYSSQVHAAKAGTVIVSQYSSSYGNYVVISHGSGNTTLYAHMSSRSVSAPLPWGGRPSNNLNPGRPSGDATKRSCLYD